MSFQAAGSPSLCTLNSCKEVYRLDLVNSIRLAKIAIRRKFLARTYVRPSVHAYLKPCPSLFSALFDEGVFVSSSSSTAACAFRAPERISAFSWPCLLTSSIIRRNSSSEIRPFVSVLQTWSATVFSLLLARMRISSCFFRFHCEATGDVFTGHSHSTAGQGGNFKAQDNGECDNSG